MYCKGENAHSASMSDGEKERGGGQDHASIAFLGRRLFLKSFKPSCTHWVFIGRKDCLYEKDNKIE